jgi:uracil-DNA glycosylase
VQGKGQNMKDRVGKFFEIREYPGIRFLLLYHPAYLLRDPRKKVDMGEHIKQLTTVLTELNRESRGAKILLS